MSATLEAQTSPRTAFDAGTAVESLPQLSAVAMKKSYRKGDHVVPVLRGVDFSLVRGEYVSIVGQSGSGKSTLLHLMGLLDTPHFGEVRLDGQRIDDLPERARDQLRNRVFGFVFQFYHLLPELSLLENVLAPMMIRHSLWDYWRRRREFQDRAKEMVARVGLGHRLTHRPRELSGGEMQRAAIARALVGRPQILLADEPTGNLDAQTGREIVDLLHDLNQTEALSIVMVTHDNQIAKEAKRTVRLSEGLIQTTAAVRAA